MRRILPLITCLVPALAAPEVRAGPRACLAPFEAAGGALWFESTPEQLATRLAEGLAGSWGVAGGTVEGLLHLARVRNVKVPSDPALVSRLVTFLERSPFPAGADLDPPLFADAADLLVLADPEAALALARRLTAFGASKAMLSRGVRLLARVGEREDLDRLGLYATNNDTALRRVAAEAVVLRGDPAQVELVMPLLSQDDEATVAKLVEAFGSGKPDPASLGLLLSRTPPEVRRRLGERLAFHSGAGDVPVPATGDATYPEFAMAFESGRAAWRTFEAALGGDPVATAKLAFQQPPPECVDRTWLFRVDAVLASRPPPVVEPTPAPKKKRGGKRKSR